jgi:hypothetical protein
MAQGGFFSQPGGQQLPGCIQETFMFKASSLCLLLALLAACSKQSPPCHRCPACPGHSHCQCRCDG